MKTQRRFPVGRAGLVTALALLGLPAMAHHSGAQYDYTQRATASGTVAKMEWANPHSRLYVDVLNDKRESAQWQFDLPSVNRLMRLGWSRHAVNPGDKVTVTFAPMRGSPQVAWAINVLDGKGKKLFVDTTAAPSEAPASP